MVPLEALEPCEQYHTYHLEGSVTNQAFLIQIEFHIGRETTDSEKEIPKVVKASIAEVSIDHITDTLADLFSKDEHFKREYTHYKNELTIPIKQKCYNRPEQNYTISVYLSPWSNYSIAVNTSHYRYQTHCLLTITLQLIQIS